MSFAPAPIPTLPISSGTAGQAAHIASLTAQLEELVSRNNQLTQHMQEERADFERRIKAERLRGDSAVRQLQQANEQEVQEWKNACDSLCVASKHASMTMAYAHSVTKHDLLVVTQQYEDLQVQLGEREMELFIANGSITDLSYQIEDLERSNSRRVRELLLEVDATHAELDAVRASLTATRTKISVKDDERLSDMKKRLQDTIAKKDELEERLDKAQSEHLVLEQACERLRLECKDEKREKKELEREMRELKDQVSDWKRLEGKEADSLKEMKKQVRELEVSLSSEQSRVEELEKENSRLRKESAKERLRLEREKEDVIREKDEVRQALRDVKKELRESRKAMEATEKENLPESLLITSKAKKVTKRPREENDALEDEGGRGATKKVQYARYVRVKPCFLTSIKPKPSEDVDKAASKARKLAKAAERAASPGLENAETEDPPKKTKKPFKPAQRRPVVDADGESEDMDTKRAKYFGLNPEDQAKGKSSKSQSKSVIKGALGDTSDEETTLNQPAKMAPKDKANGASKATTSKSKSKAKTLAPLDSEEGENFDVDAISSTDEDEDDQVKVVEKKPTKTKKATGVGATKQRKTAKENPQEQVKAGKQVPTTEAEKPKKRTLNLLAGAGAGEGISSWWDNIAMVTITIESSKKKISRAPDLPYNVVFPDPNLATIADVKKLLSVKYPKFPASRQRLTLPQTSPDGKGRPLKDSESLTAAGLENGGILHLKDLGPQFSWTTVFLTEYAGPIFIHFLIYNYFPWDVTFQKSKMQTFAYWMFMLHFIKRELETIFVHRFSHATMPAFNIVRNSAHYWLLAGVMSAVSIYGPWNSHLRLAGSGSWRDEDWFLWGCAAVWTACELMNLSAHLTLRSLRPEGSGKRGIPHSWLFDTLNVSCANYTTEIAGWLIVCVMTGDLWTMIYVLTGVITMTKWGLAKHARYRKEFDDYPKSRKALFPFIL
ncbi:3-oxo-5a-steroid 4- dehydrogenase [Serendipita sp. 399]|nr:3-oxo-5a-steroid 4- dehydrogenase [Serendipita sp. 399]